MKKKVLCTALASMMLMTTTASAEPWWISRYRVTFDNSKMLFWRNREENQQRPFNYFKRNQKAFCY